MANSKGHKQRKPYAQRRPKEGHRMILTGADRDVFLEAVMNPPAPTKRLVSALKKHRALYG